MCVICVNLWQSLDRFSPSSLRWSQRSTCLICRMRRSTSGAMKRTSRRSATPSRKPGARERRSPAVVRSTSPIRSVSRPCRGATRITTRSSLPRRAGELVAPPTIASRACPSRSSAACLSAAYTVARRIIGGQLPALIAALVIAPSLRYSSFSAGRRWTTSCPCRSCLAGYGVSTAPFAHARRRARRVGEPHPRRRCQLYRLVGRHAVAAEISWALWLRAGLGRRQIAVSAIALRFRHDRAFVDRAPSANAARHLGAIRRAARRAEDAARTDVLELDSTRAMVRARRASLTTATARSGVVLLPVAALLVAGAIDLFRRRDWRATVIVAGVLIGLNPAAIKGEPAWFSARCTCCRLSLRSRIRFRVAVAIAPQRGFAALLIAGSALQFGALTSHFFSTTSSARRSTTIRSSFRLSRRIDPSPR